MTLVLDISFHTDGDFCVNDLESIFNKGSRLYKDANLIYSAEQSDESLEFALIASGDENAGRWAARDLLQSLICEFRTFKSYLVGDLYRFLDTPLVIVQKRGNEVRYEDNLSGNYEGTYLLLQITH